MGKAMTVTDTKTLWGEDPDKRNPCSTSICLNYSHLFIVITLSWNAITCFLESS